MRLLADSHWLWMVGWEEFYSVRSAAARIYGSIGRLPIIHGYPTYRIVLFLGRRFVIGHLMWVAAEFARRVGMMIARGGR